MCLSAHMKIRQRARDNGLFNTILTAQCCFYLTHVGYYWIDPNEGCSSDAEYIYCDFENKRACVHPKKENVSLSEGSLQLIYT